MNVPTISTAEKMLNEASNLNSGVWIAHNKVAAECASKIAVKCDLDEQAAYVLGLLHDIGRRYGVNDLLHTINGYKYMLEQNYADSARICLTHSFPYKDILSYNGEDDCSKEDSYFIKKYLGEIEYNDYDRLIQLCDAISFPTGPCYIEKRLVDVVMRRGFNELTIPKWKEFFNIKEYFEIKIKCSIYDIVGIE